MITIAFLLILLTIFLLGISRPLLNTWRFLKKVDKLPTPPGRLPLLGHSLEMTVPLTRIFDLAITYVDSFPKMFVIWFGPVPCLVVTSPELLEIVLGSSKHIEKIFQYQFLEPWLGKGLLTSSGAKWRSHRKMLTPAFHFSILENFVDVFVEKSQTLVQTLEEQLPSESIDIFPYVSRCTLDIICETAMGVSINAQDVEQKSDYIDAVSDFTGDVSHRMLHPWLYPNFIYKITPSGRRMQKTLDILHAYSRKVIRDRKALFKLRKSRKNSIAEDIIEGRKKKLAFLDILLEAQENGNSLTDEEIREEVDTFMFEGQDTTAAAIAWALKLLGENLDVQEKVYEELQEIFEGSDRPPTSKDLSNMKYLDRVIKECLRHCPSVPAMGRVLSEDVQFDGYTIPAGLLVAPLTILMHWIPAHFEDSLKFNPDNFLPEKIVGRHPYAYIPFSAGPRNCIGQKFAMMELKTLLSSVIRNFKFVRVGEEPELLPELILRPDPGVHLKIVKRNALDCDVSKYVFNRPRCPVPMF